MRAISFLTLIILCSQTAPLRSQVLLPAEVKDEGARGLQEKYFVNLKTIAHDVKGHSFPYHFYFSRVLDVTERQQQGSDQRSIQFDHFQGKLIFKATGNYYAAYSAESMDREQRARQTFIDVMLPILRAAVTQFHDSDVPESYAFEISHHVRKNVVGVLTEGMENVVLVLPKRSAVDLVAASDVAHQNVALLKAVAFVDGKPLTFWPADDSNGAANPETVMAAPPQPAAPAPTVQSPVAVKEIPPADGSLTLQTLGEHYRTDLDRMVRELDAQAHFVTYAAPAFIEFRKGRYLQLSVVTTLADQSAGSPYQLTAGAFDKHIAHLLRPVLAYLKDAKDFDGIDISTTIHVGSSSESKLAVEYLFPLDALRKYASYDSTGQQLLDAGFILINGERAGLDLQAAENK